MFPFKMSNWIASLMKSWAIWDRSRTGSCIPVSTRSKGPVTAWLLDQVPTTLKFKLQATTAGQMEAEKIGPRYHGPLRAG